MNRCPQTAEPGVQELRDLGSSLELNRARPHLVAEPAWRPVYSVHMTMDPMPSLVADILPRSTDGSTPETRLLLPGERPDVNKELAARIRLIFQEYDAGLQGFFDAIEQEQKEQEQAAVRLTEDKVKRLLEKALLSSSVESRAFR